MEYLPDDPFLPPDWRWRRARFLYDRRLWCRPNDDKYVEAAKMFLYVEAGCKKPVDHQDLMARYPGIYWAEKIHREENPVRWAIEAFLLSGAHTSQIAEWTKTSVETSFWYEKLFFNVAPYLQNELYIINVVMGEAVQRGVTERDYDILWKMLGYGAGPILLRAYMRPFLGSRVTDPDQTNAAYVNAHFRQILRKSATAALTVPVHNHHEVIFNAFHRIQELEQAKGGASQAEGSIKENIQAAMRTFRDVFIVGDNPTGIPPLG